MSDGVLVFSEGISDGVDPLSYHEVIRIGELQVGEAGPVYLEQSYVVVAGPRQDGRWVFFPVEGHDLIAQVGLFHHVVVGDDVSVLCHKESGSLHDVDFSILVRWLLVSGGDADSVEDDETADVALGDLLFPGDTDHG